MKYGPTKFDPDVDIAPVEQVNGTSVSEMLITGVVPPVVKNEEFMELDHNKIYGRPGDVFDALSMQKTLAKNGAAAAQAAAQSNNNEQA